MVGLTENIQACLRIFWQLQHQWLTRDILHLPQGVFYVFVLWPGLGFKMFKWFKMFKRFKGFNSAQSVYSSLE